MQATNKSSRVTVFLGPRSRLKINSSILEEMLRIRINVTGHNIVRECRLKHTNLTDCNKKRTKDRILKRKHTTYFQWCFKFQ